MNLFFPSLAIAFLLAALTTVGAQPPDRAAIKLVPYARGLLQPTHINHAGDRSNRLFVTEQKGRVMLVKEGAVLPEPFLDIRNRVSCCGERGLLSVVFPPGFAGKRYFYVNYTDREGDTVIARYRVTSNPDRADPQSEEILLKVEQPYPNHNGGQMAFGPDGFLYIGMGDGGSAGDPQGNGQDPGTLLGKLLRIDVETGMKPYAVPSGNPFIKQKEWRPEIWVYGLRNPWRFSFDRKTGDLYIADVGQNRYEEIDFQPAASGGGENYGWNIMEGAHCFRGVKCQTAGLTLPVAEYPLQDGNCSAIGGMVYRGKLHPALEGIYFFADYCSGRIWSLERVNGKWDMQLLLDTEYAVSTFGEDEQGELYVGDHKSGAIYRITAATKKRNAQR